MIWLLTGFNKDEKVINGSVAIYNDNSLSSTLNESGLTVQDGVNTLSKDATSIYYFDNNKNIFLGKSQNVLVPGEVSINAIKPLKLFKDIEESGASECYLFSDFQLVDLQEMSESMVDSSISYNLVLTNELNTVRNVFVDSLYLRPNQENLSELSVLVDFSVENMPSGSIVVKLMQGQRQLSSIVKDVSEIDNVRFDISKESYGKYEIVIDGDDVAYDNTFHFTIGKKAKTRIVVIDSKNSGVLREVYGNKELFDIEIQSFGNIDYEQLQSCDLIVLSDFQTLPENLKRQLAEISFIVFPADSVDLDSYESFLGLQLSELEENLTEIDIDMSHPLLNGVFENKSKSGPRSREVALFQIKGEFESVISFRGKFPFLLEKNKVYFFNYNLKPSSGGFTSNALFLPLMYQIAFSSSGNIDVPYFYPGDKMIVSTKVSDIPVKIVTANYEVIPVFNSSDANITIELPLDLSPGEYLVTQGSDTLKRISVNVPKEESLMTAPELAEMEKIFSNSPNVSVSQIVYDNNNVVFASGSQSSLWKYALILTVFLLLTETVLHRYFR